MSLPTSRVYYVRFKSERNGPYTARDVIDMLRNREISMLHQVSDGQRCWNMDAFIDALEAPVRDDQSGGSSQADIPESGETVREEKPQAITDRCAIAAFGFMCLGFLLGALSAIPAVYLGHMALDSIQAHAGRKGMGLALTALVVGYAQIVLSIVLLILFLILF